MKYTNEEYARSYTEILEIFKYIPENLIKKIPESMIKRFYQNMDKNHFFLYDIKKNFEEQKISHLTTIIFANLYINYWASEKDKNRINEYDKKILIEKEQEKLKKYNPNEIFNRRNEINNKTKEEKSLIEIENKSFFRKIIDKIITFIKRK